MDFFSQNLRGTHTRPTNSHSTLVTAAGTDGPTIPRPVGHREVPWALSTTHNGSVWMMQHIPELYVLGHEAY